MSKMMVILMSLQPFRMYVTLLFVSVPDVGSGWLLGVLGKCRLVRFPVCFWRSQHSRTRLQAGQPAPENLPYMLLKILLELN